MRLTEHDYTLSRYQLVRGTHEETWIERRTGAILAALVLAAALMGGLMGG